MYTRTNAFLILGLAGGLASLGCGANSAASRTDSPAVTGTSQGPISRISGVVISSAGVSSSGVTIQSVQTPSPVNGVQVSVANGGQTATTDNQGRFTLNNTPVGSNQLQLNNGALGSVNITTNPGMELNVAVAVNGQSASLQCQSQRPMGNTNAENACDVPNSGNGGNTGNNGTNGGNGGNGGSGGNGGNGGGGNNGGTNGGGGD